MSGWRLPAGGAVDRARPLAFEFDGQAVTGFEGDTVASALLAADVRVVARSFKLHRPRGIVGLGWDDPCALLQVLKYMPSSIELQAAVDISNAEEAGQAAVLEGDLVRILDPETGEIAAPPPSPTPMPRADKPGNAAEKLRQAVGAPAPQGPEVAP